MVGGCRVVHRALQELMTRYIIHGINPEPWVTSEAATGKRNGKIFTRFFKSAGLDAYQKAVQSELREQIQEFHPEPTSIGLTFYFWRQLTAYEADSKTVRKHAADATNMQKAIEDAMQGIAFDNDRQVIHSESWIMDVGLHVEPLIVIDVTSSPGRPDLHDIYLFRPSVVIPTDERADLKVSEVF